MLKTDLNSLLAATVTILEDLPSKPLFDLFALEHHTHPSHGKRPLIEDDDTKERHVCQKTSMIN